MTLAEHDLALSPSQMRDRAERLLRASDKQATHVAYLRQRAADLKAEADKRDLFEVTVEIAGEKRSFSLPTSARMGQFWVERIDNIEVDGGRWFAEIQMVRAF